MATKLAAQPASEPAVQKPVKLFVKSVVGPMLDLTNNRRIHGADYHENTAWLKAQMAAGKIIEAVPGE